MVMSRFMECVVMATTLGHATMATTCQNGTMSHGPWQQQI